MEESLSTAEKPSYLPEDAFETGAPEGTLGAEEELWLADPQTLKLAGGAQKILAAEPADHFSGELIDCVLASISQSISSPEKWSAGSAPAGPTRSGIGASKRS
jgi:hypothetical protein